MAIVASTRKKLSLSRDGSTWLDFPRLPNQLNPIKPGDLQTRLDGTKQIPIYWALEAVWDILTAKEYGKLMSLFDPDAQDILLNYYAFSVTAPDYTVDTSWYYAPAVFAEPPDARPDKRNFKDIRVLFTRVEWKGVNPV